MISKMIFLQMKKVLSLQILIKTKMQMTYFLLEEDLKTFGGHEINEKIKKMYTDCKLPNWVLDIVVHRLCFLPNQVIG